MIEIKKRLEDEMKTLDYELKVQLPKEILKAREHGDLRARGGLLAGVTGGSFCVRRGDPD